MRTLTFSSEPHGADDPRGALEPGDLADLAADGTRGAGHEDGVALLERADPQQTRVRRQAGHAEDAEVRAQRRGLRVDLDGGLRVHDRVLAPAEEVQEVVADGYALGVGGDDLADRAALHDLAELEGRDVRLRVAHAAAHVRVDREVLVADQHLPLARRPDLGLDQGEVLWLRPADGTAEQVPFAVDHDESLSGVCGQCFRCEYFST